MRLDEITQPKVKRFRVSSDKPLSFSDVEKHEEVKKRAGPNTTVYDVSADDDVRKAPGENKWNTLLRKFHQDNDTILCASTNFGKEWLCMAFNIEK